MLASVLIVEYRTKQYLPACLDAILASSLPDEEYEVIVVDNASPTPVADLWAAYPRVRFLTSRRNLGFAGGNALGLEHALGEHIVLLNPDAVVTPSWLGEILAPLEDPSVGVVGGKLLHPGTDVLQHAGGVLFDNALSTHLGRGERDFGQWDRTLDVDYVCGATISLSRRTIERVGSCHRATSPPTTRRPSSAYARARLGSEWCMHRARSPTITKGSRAALLKPMPTSSGSTRAACASCFGTTRHGTCSLASCPRSSRGSLDTARLPSEGSARAPTSQAGARRGTSPKARPPRAT
ncbi:MAG: glycosyltransferase [Polyangiaceae bacterium]